MSRKPPNWFFFRQLLSVIVFFLSFSIINGFFSVSRRLTAPTLSPRTLGEEVSFPKLIISGGEGYAGGGVIALTSVAEPVVEIGSYNLSGRAKVDVYKAGGDDLLNYLVHDKEGRQLRRGVDINGLQYIASTEEQITSGYDKSTRVTLPISGTGIWCLKIQLGDIAEYVFVIRSGIGAIAKEGDNEFIVWGQDLVTKRSLAGGQIKVYHLLDGVSEIADVGFNSQGIAKTNLASEADIGLVRNGEELALVPLNLRYLNQGYAYSYFQPKQRESRFFVFTDRPLYQPGDKVYFKSIIRDDDDVRYALPAGMALVRSYESGSRESPVFEKSYSITPRGTVYGEFSLPADAKTGYYSLSIDLSPGEENYLLKTSSFFQVEYFRKPEYTISIDVPRKEYIAGDESWFEIGGQYFSGQSLVGQTVKYKIYSANFYEYEYLTDTNLQFNDGYRYGFWGGRIIKEDTVVLDQEGKAKVNLQMILPEEERKSQVFSIEAELDDGSGNPVFDRKNILVYSGEYGIYRRDSVYTSRVGERASLLLVLKPHQDTEVAGIPLKARVKRETWIRYQEPDKKYPSYRKEDEDLPELKTTVSQAGEAVFSFIPSKSGSYRLTVEGGDARGNIIVKDFYIWIVSADQPFYKGGGSKGLTVQPDKGRYSYTETVRMTIVSDIGDRDVFLSLDRGRVNRFQIIRLSGKSATIDIPLQPTDMPNIFAKAASFSDYSLDADTSNIIVSSEPKKLNVLLAPDKETYGPGETVTVDIKTTDFSGKPASADTALWAVDKALFELVDEQPREIFGTFWQERWNSTMETHSLQGLNVQAAEGGGGCFDGETPVLMASGRVEPIKDIKVGQKILTRRSEKDNRLIKASVKATHSVEADGYFVINHYLKVTPNHRLWVNGGWREVNRISMGDILLGPDGQKVEVVSLEWQEGRVKVYNLTIEKYQTYFAGGIWVHNQKGGGGRTVFRDTAYWNPSIQTDADGQAQINFKLPDNLTTWVIASVGSTDDTKVGQSTTEVVVAKEVVVRPVLPNILQIGDLIVLSAMIHNFTGVDRTFSVGLKSDFIEVNPDKEVAVLIKSKDKARVYWQVRPQKEDEKARLVFSAGDRDEEKIADAVTREIPIRAFGFWEKRGQNGEGNQEYQVRLAPDSHPEKSKVKLSLAPSLLGALPTAMKYLVDYPWGCVEQTTSRFVPAVIAKKNLDIFGSFLADKDVDDIIRKGIVRLAKLQQGDGGWTWWFTGGSDPFLTAYVVEYLLEAREVGAKVDERILKTAQGFLEKQSDGNRDNLVAGTYGLSLLGADGGQKILDDFSDVKPDILALMVMANVRNGEMNPGRNGLNRLMEMGQEQGEAVYWQAGEKERFASKDASTALAIRALMTGNGDRNLATKAARFLLRNRQSDYWSNTFATAMVVQSAVDFARAGEELAPDFAYTVKLDGQPLASGKVTDSSRLLDEVVIGGDKIKKNGSALLVEKTDGPGQIYSTLLVEEFHTDRESLAVNHGLEIKREYINQKGDGYDLSVGDMVTVKISVGGLMAAENYGIIADELPSGMIPVNPVFKNVSYGQPEPVYISGVSDREVTLNGMVLSLRKIEPGTDDYTYQARVISEGRFSVPPAVASLMYAPEIYGRSQSQALEIGKRSGFIPELESFTVPGWWQNPWIISAGIAVLAILAGGVVVIRRRKRKQEPPLSPPPLPPVPAQDE